MCHKASRLVELKQLAEVQLPNKAPVSGYFIGNALPPDCILLQLPVMLTFSCFENVTCQVEFW